MKFLKYQIIQRTFWTSPKFDFTNSPFLPIFKWLTNPGFLVLYALLTLEIFQVVKYLILLAKFEENLKVHLSNISASATANYCFFTCEKFIFYLAGKFFFYRYLENHFFSLQNFMFCEDSNSCCKQSNSTKFHSGNL